MILHLRFVCSLKFLFPFFLLFGAMACRTTETERNVFRENPKKNLGTDSKYELEDGLYAVHYGNGRRLELSDESEDGTERKETVFLFYLIKSGNRILLIDSGISSVRTKDRYGLKDWASPSTILEKAGIRGSMVTDIVLTHFSADHAGGLDLFPRARVFINPNDWELLKKTDWFPNLRKILHTKEKDKKLTFVQGSLEVFPDFRILFTGGRTPGHSAVEWLRFPKNRVLFAGDECIFTELCAGGKDPAGLPLYSVKNHREFIQYLELLVEQGTKILTFHDPSLLRPEEEVFPRIYRIP
ncbi:MBL fold metallo-hydrolase [Leptospira fletcheri]|uniref:MBL fold metallo-hydrolase n=1 Tax=Leptospira fletcheri TaxID=2484981 RepID=A0A4R9GGZ5_9LEPT|nr:MBL fold metallo-hydrolase [Leptospira fletcheri]TGK11601.1 MBL fold metallo-hydrolase [Leptospira fletcheri]